MAIVQISQITNRKGRAENLPQLAGAEFGWSTDTRQLFIGNGTLEDGAPVIGNTEILTEFSDILNLSSTYTYSGTAATGYPAQTGVTAGTPVTQSLQNWLDQFATVKDFGATGDGVTDDTAAINRALYQLYCRELNPQIRRSLFFPAGVYRVTSSIKIPPYATLYGEGIDNSVIQLDSTASGYVAQTADSLQNTGIDIGVGGTTTPKYITISNIGFTNLNPTGSVFLVQDASNGRFQNVGFRGPMTTANLNSDTNGSIGVNFLPIDPTDPTSPPAGEQITFDGCVFSGLVWGINTSRQTKAVTICNGEFDTLHQGVLLGTGDTTNSNGGPTGTRIVSNMFNNIYAEGIIFGSNLNPGINASGQNIFYDVGNHFSGSNGTPATSIISIQSDNNLSISDLFQRTDAYATTYPRVSLNATMSIATTNGESLSMGTYTRASGQSWPLENNSQGTIFTLGNAVLDNYRTFMIDYNIIRDVTYRTGTIMVAAAGGTNILQFTDTNVQNGNTGITLNVTQGINGITLDFTSTDGIPGEPGNPKLPGTISYSIRNFN